MVFLESYFRRSIVMFAFETEEKESGQFKTSQERVCLVYALDVSLGPLCGSGLV